MSILWTYFWPLFAIGLLFGAVGGWLAIRRHQPSWLAVAAAIALLGGILWHGPFGAADRLASGIERTARAALTYYEMSGVEAHLHRGPLSRTLVLTGPVDDFQRTELVRLFAQIPGVGIATWSNGSVGVPLILEALLAATAGFLLGLLLAYVIELRRRHNAQWKW